MNPEETKNTKPQSQDSAKSKTGTADADFTTSKLASSAPAGGVSKIVSFASKHKKGGLTGAITAITVVMFMTFIGGIASTQLIWMNNIMQGFHYGPYDRSVSNQANRTIRAYQRANDNTALGRKMTSATQDTVRSNRVQGTNINDVSRLNRRGFHRNSIGTKINNVRSRLGKPSFRWKVFDNKAAGREGWISPRLLLRGVSDQTGNRRVTGVRPDIDNTVNRMADSNTSQRKVIARGFARGAGVTASTAVTTFICLSAAYDDMLPDDEEMYEMFLSMASSFNAAGAQLAAGEDVHSDEIADAMDAYYETIEVGGSHDEDLEYVDAAINEDGDVNFSHSDSRGDSTEDPVSRSHDAATDSAAWKRAVNIPLNNNETDIHMAYGDLGSFMAVNNVIRSVGGAANFISAGNTAIACGVASFLTIPLLALEIKATIGTGGGAQLGARVLTHGVIGLAIANYLEGLASGGFMPELPSTTMGMTGVGHELAQSEVARSQGSVPISSDQANQRRAQHFEKLAQEDREKGFVWRYLSPDNPRSTLTNFAMTANPSLKGTINYLASIPRRLPSLIARATSSPTYADMDYDHYGINLYDMSDRQMSLDIIDNAEIVESWFSDIDSLELYYCESGVLNEEGQDTQEISESNLVGSDGLACNMDRWKKATTTQIIIDYCMSLPYYEMENNRWRFSSDSSPVQQTVNCAEPSDEHLDVWERVGLYKLTHDLVDSINCLSHNSPCPGLGVGFFETPPQNQEVEDDEGG